MFKNIICIYILISKYIFDKDQIRDEIYSINVFIIIFIKQ